jgi:hypothetical protein
VDALEERRMLAITPDALVQTASWLDNDGDTVSVRVTGSVTDTATQGFKVQLAGLATDRADAQTISLFNLGSTNGLEVLVTPNPLASQPGAGFATMYSAGYSNVFRIQNGADSTMTSLGGIHLSAAIVNKIDLTGIEVVNDITLDPGQAPFCDRINTQNNQQGMDSTMYQPVTGLIHLGGIVASSVGSLVIDGAVSSKTNNAWDTTTSNDFRSVIEVEGRIGSIVGLRSSLRGRIHANSIGTIRVGAISAEVTTRDTTQDLSVNLTGHFAGFINSAGHLHLGMTQGDATLVTGNITALGISGTVKETFREDRYRDPLYFPGTYSGSITLTGDPAAAIAGAYGTTYQQHPEAVGRFPDIAVSGIAMFSLNTLHGSISDISSDGFGATFVALAEQGSIGNLDAGIGNFSGHLRAKDDIGDISAPLGFLGTVVSTAGNVGKVSATTGNFQGFIQAAGNVGDIAVLGDVNSYAQGATVIAGGSIGSITTLTGGIEGSFQAQKSIGNIYASSDIIGGILARTGNIGSITSKTGHLESQSIQAGGNIGAMSLYTGIQQTTIVAGGDLGAIEVRVGLIELATVSAVNIGNITVVAGSIHSSSFVASGNVGTITAFGPYFGLADTSIVAGGAIGQIDAQSFTGDAIRTVKLEAGGKVAGITGISYGSYGTLIGNGIFTSAFVAGSYGPILGRSAGGIGIQTSTFVTSKASEPFTSSDRSVGSIDSLQGLGWTGGMQGVTVVTSTDIGSITGKSSLYGAGIELSTFNSSYGKIGLVTAVGGAAGGGPGGVPGPGPGPGPGPNPGGSGIVASRFQATDETYGGITGMTVSAYADTVPALGQTLVYAKEIGAIKVNLVGGQSGDGIAGCEIRAFSGSIQSLDVDVRSITGVGVRNAKVEASGSIGPMTVWAFNATAIQGSEFVSHGDFGSITATAQNGGNAIDSSTFTAPGRNFYDAADPSLNRDPRGNFGSITVSANGTDSQSNGVVNSSFSAIGTIGQITVSSRGGAGIMGSTFEADTDGDFSPLAAAESPQARGTISGITVVAAGRNVDASSGIINSTFTAATIGIIAVDVQTVQGGGGILGSVFAAKTAVDDGRGNFDNTGTIGSITVKNASMQPGVGNGVSASVFRAGAAGGIGNVSVTTASGSAIVASTFDASVEDRDQNQYTSTIGVVTVKAGRTANSTFNPAGITGSTFTAAAGIGGISVASSGVGISNSSINADFDWSTSGRIPGSLGDLVVQVPGRSASGVVQSQFFAATIGDISVTLNNDAANAWNTVERSSFRAWQGSIGNITVVHSQTGVPYSTGNAYAVLYSTFIAATAIGTVSIEGRTLGCVFIVNGTVSVQPQSALQLQARSSGGQARAVPLATPTAIGAVTVTGADQSDITFQTSGDIASMDFRSLPASATVKLTLAAASVGPLSVSGLGLTTTNLSGRVASFGDITVSGDVSMDVPNATSMGAVTVFGNALLNTPALQAVNSLDVASRLTLPGGLPSLRQMGRFDVGSLAASVKNVLIGAKSAVGTSIGSIHIGSRNTGKGQYQFAFAQYDGTPNNVSVAGKAVKVVAVKPVVVNGVSFVRLPTPAAPPLKVAKAPVAKPQAAVR